MVAIGLGPLGLWPLGVRPFRLGAVGLGAARLGATLGAAGLGAARLREGRRASAGMRWFHGRGYTGVVAWRLRQSAAAALTRCRARRYVAPSAPWRDARVVKGDGL